MGAGFGLRGLGGFVAGSVTLLCRRLSNSSIAEGPAAVGGGVCAAVMVGVIGGVPGAGLAISGALSAAAGGAVEAGVGAVVAGATGAAAGAISALEGVAGATSRCMNQ